MRMGLGCVVGIDEGKPVRRATDGSACGPPLGPVLFDQSNPMDRAIDFRVSAPRPANHGCRAIGIRI